MIGEVLTRCLILVFGFAYPACQCFKAVETNRTDNNELRFWCQYWIIVAILTVCENVADMALSWLPVYDELKLGFIIYLWHSKTKGSRHVYETMLKPYVRGNETEIELRLVKMKTRLWNVAVYYWHNWTELGQTAMFQILDYISADSGKFSSFRIQDQEERKKRNPDSGGIKSWHCHDAGERVESLAAYIFSETEVPVDKPRQRKHWLFRRS